MSEAIKCLVWDLDNTLWQGTLAESDHCVLKYGIKTVLRQLDDRGILLSIASANDMNPAMACLKSHGIEKYFLHPQIGWASKVGYLKNIASRLNLSLDSFGFIDDEPFQLEQVRQHLPFVRVYHADEYRLLPDRPEFKLQFQTEESNRRRQIYAGHVLSGDDPTGFRMTQMAFLKSCRMQIHIRRAVISDFPRILELMHRTHQLNATGIIYSENRIKSLWVRPDHCIYLAELRDRFADYGRIGAAICRFQQPRMNILAFMLSCRILGRGIGRFFLSWLEARAFQMGMTEVACNYIKNEKNGKMVMLFRLAGFKTDKKQKNGCLHLSKESNNKCQIPQWLTLTEEERHHEIPETAAH